LVKSKTIAAGKTIVKQVVPPATQDAAGRPQQEQERLVFTA
jgi:hypothetical protein